jgi:hypothetical protein
MWQEVGANGSVSNASKVNDILVEFLNEHP